MASSSDGAKLVAMTNDGGYIYTSSDSGVTWTQTTAPQQDWVSVASSSDGTNLAAMTNDGGYIYTSADSGVTWTQTTAPQQDWVSVASSSDGTNLVAVSGGVLVDGAVVNDGYIYTSSDSGVTWTQRE